MDCGGAPPLLSRRLVNNRREVVTNVHASVSKPICPRNTRKEARISEAKIDRFMFPWQQTLVFHSQTFFILAHPRKHFLQKATKKTKTAICSRNLRYLRFLLLNSSPLAQLSRKRDFLQKTTKETKICSFVCQRASLPSVNSNYCELL